MKVSPDQELHLKGFIRHLFAPSFFVVEINHFCCQSSELYKIVVQLKFAVSQIFGLNIIFASKKLLFG